MKNFNLYVVIFISFFIFSCSKNNDEFVKSLEEKGDSSSINNSNTSASNNKRSNTVYRITVVTGSVIGAGTDANVYITLYGDKNSGEMELDSFRDNFERGNIDVFSIEMQDIGNIKRIRIRHNNAKDEPGWFLDKIIVHNEFNDREWTFPCHRWLAFNDDDGQIIRILDKK